MIRIRVSYQDEKELDEVIKRFDNVSKKVKRSGNTEGKYKKAYIDLLGGDKKCKDVI